MQDPEEGRPMEGRAFRNIGKNIYIYIFPTVKSTLPLLFKTHIYFLKIVLFYFMESKFTGNFDN